MGEDPLCLQSREGAHPPDGLQGRIKAPGTLRRTWAEIDLDALAHNYRTLRARMGEQSRFLGVVKADAYGHGAVEVSRTLEELGAAYLAVSSVDEARDRVGRRLLRLGPGLGRRVLRRLGGLGLLFGRGVGGLGGLVRRSGVRAAGLPWRSWGRLTWRCPAWTKPGSCGGRASACPSCSWA